MALDFDTCYRAVVARDPRFDGRFFTGVTSTGIYCRPICPARTPARANLRLIADGYVDSHGISGLAARLAVTQRHLHRLLVTELGTGPLALARTARLQTARR